MSEDIDPKYAKKMEKARAKALKKQVKVLGSDIAAGDSHGKSPAERSADAAERQVSLHRWRIVFAVISTLIALASLIILFLKN